MQKTHGIPFVPVLGILLVLAPSVSLADAEPKPAPMNNPSPPPSETLSKIHPWAKEKVALTGINLDPVLRAIVCRVPFTNWSLDALMLGTKISRERFERGAGLLEGIGLITIYRANGITLLKPASNKIRAEMRKWAYEWCTSEERCEIGR